jgi:hypothetical protein
MAREREGFFGFRFKINGFLPGFAPSCRIQGRGSMKKGGWHIMRRLIVLCAIFLSVLTFTGNVCAIEIKGAVWSSVWNTDALKSATYPSIGPPTNTATPDATFVISDINFDSRRLKLEDPSKITYNEFLNNPTWNKPENKEFDPNGSMFTGPGQGIFFQFTWSLDLSREALPVTITHDDGFFFYVFNIFKAGSDGAFKEPQVSILSDLMVKDPGKYSVTLNYGALNDTDTHVLIFSTPEPGSMLLFALGIIGIGVLRRRH